MSILEPRSYSSDVIVWRTKALQELHMIDGDDGEGDGYSVRNKEGCCFCGGPWDNDLTRSVVIGCFSLCFPIASAVSCIHNTGGASINLTRTCISDKEESNKITYTALRQLCMGPRDLFCGTWNTIGGCSTALTCNGCGCCGCCNNDSCIPSAMGNAIDDAEITTFEDKPWVEEFCELPRMESFMRLDHPSVGFRKLKRAIEKGQFRIAEVCIDRGVYESIPEKQRQEIINLLINKYIDSKPSSNQQDGPRDKMLTLFFTSERDMQTLLEVLDNRNLSKEWDEIIWGIAQITFTRKISKTVHRHLRLPRDLTNLVIEYIEHIVPKEIFTDRHHSTYGPVPVDMV